MSINIEVSTPEGQLLELGDQEMGAVERAILERVLALSLETSSNCCRKQNSLSLKYRKLITNMKMTKSSQKCTVCYSSFCEGEVIKRFPCKHIFHRECAKSWLKVYRNCPNCRLDLEHHFEELERQANSEENEASRAAQKNWKQTN